MTVAWRQLSPANAPSPRTSAAAGLDLNTGTNILFGGAASTGNSYYTPAETWEWDGVDWTQLSPATVPAPSAANRRFLSGDMGWDGINDKLMMVLSEFSTSGPFTAESLRFFHWDAGDWTEVFFAFTFPGPLGASSYQSVLSWNPDLGKLLLFVSNATSIYEWDGTDWSATGNFPAITGAIAPYRISGNGGFTYDPFLGVTVYYGGIDSTVLGQFAYDTAFYNGSWTAAAYTPPPAEPLARFVNRYTAYLNCARGVVMYGDQLSPSPSTPPRTTLILRDVGGGTYEWVDQGLALAPNSAQGGMLMETAQGKVLYFGGNYGATLYDETWLLSCLSVQVMRWH